MVAEIVRKGRGLCYNAGLWVVRMSKKIFNGLYFMELPREGASAGVIFSAYPHKETDFA